MLKKVFIGFLMALLPFMALAQGSGGQVRRLVKKQETISTPAKKRQSSKKRSEQNQIVTHEEVSPTEATGYDVTISCNVPSASLYIDGTAYGTASGSRFLKAGTHMVKLQANGYEPLSSSITVGSKSTSFSFTMKEEENKLPLVIQRLLDNMVYVEGGTFTMGATSEQGSDAEMDERPAHRVTVSSFSIGKYEVTQEEWEAVMGSNPSRFKGAKCPVENVSWGDCRQFISRLNSLTGKNFRMLTEAEWEFAARGGNKSRGYKYAGSSILDDVGWYNGISSTSSHEVGQLVPNELGIYDMSGNVCEWCVDWFGSYEFGAQTNPTGASSGFFRLIRGGSWCYGAGSCRVSSRDGSSPHNRFSYLGLRLAL